MLKTLLWVVAYLAGMAFTNGWNAERYSTSSFREGLVSFGLCLIWPIWLPLTILGEFRLHFRDFRSNIQSRAPGRKWKWYVIPMAAVISFRKSIHF